MSKEAWFRLVIILWLAGLTFNEYRHEQLITAIMEIGVQIVQELNRI